MNKKIVVIGAGISGLTAAYFLKQKGFDITVLEKKSDVGGMIETSYENGFLFEKGANSALEITPLILRIVKELNLNDQFLYANKTANKKYILRDNTLHPLPLNASAILKSKLFSAKAKLRLIAEPFIGKSQNAYYQSVAEFTTHRLGKEVLDYVINPLVGETYTGNPESLSIKSAFPLLYELEEKYGSLTVGTIKSIKERKYSKGESKQSGKMFSFKNGMTVLPNALAKYLDKSVTTKCEVKKVEIFEDRYKLTFDHQGESVSLLADIVISSVPAYTAADLFGHFDEGLKKHLLDIQYPPLLVQYLVYRKADIQQSLDAYGFFVPSKEKKSFLGSIWNSAIFPNRVSDEFASFTLFIGGAREPEILTIDKELLLMKVRGEFETLMKVSGEPIYSSYKFWPKAIPQYTIGYIEHENYIDNFEKKFPGIILNANYRGGISIAECIKNSERVVEKVSVI